MNTSGTTCSRCSSSRGFSRLFSTQLKAAMESCEGAARRDVAPRQGLHECRRSAAATPHLAGVDREDDFARRARLAGAGSRASCCLGGCLQPAAAPGVPSLRACPPLPDLRCLLHLRNTSDAQERGVRDRPHACPHAVKAGLVCGSHSSDVHETSA